MMDQQLIARIRSAAAQRSAELGGRGLITPAEIQVAIEPHPVAPGCRLFTAAWGAGDNSNSLSGLLRDDEPPETYPGQAVAKLFERWGGSGWPDAAKVAAAVALLLDPERRNTPILTEQERQGHPGATLPQLLASPPRGVTMWRTDGGPPRRLTVLGDQSGRISVTESRPVAGGVS